MVRIIEASGRKAVFVVPPDKSTIYPEFLPDGGFAEADCYAAGARRRGRRSRARATACWGCARRCSRARQPPPEETYHSGDTHWNTKGGIQAGAAVLKAIGGAGDAATATSTSSAQDYQGDLTGLVGAPEEAQHALVGDQAPRPEAADLHRGAVRRRARWVAHRPAARAAARADDLRLRLVRDRPDRRHLDLHRRVRGRPLVRRVPPEIIKAIAADTVVLEKVERDITYLTSDGGIVTDAFLDQLEARLRRH